MFEEQFLLAVLEKKKDEVLQPALEHPLIEPKRYKEFCNDYNNKGFEYCTKKYVYKNRKLQIRKIADKIGLLKIYLSLKQK